jgi:hypothetical protein
MPIAGTSVSTVGRGPGNSVLGTSFNQVLKNAPNAPIKPPKVTMPNAAGYGPNPERPLIPGVTRKDFGMPDRTGIDAAAKEAAAAVRGFNDPTSTGAFKAAMGLAAEKGASAVSEYQRTGRDAASRAGYTGGFNVGAKKADAERFKALSEAGFAGVASVRADEANMYGHASSALSSLMSSYNSAITASNVGFATTKAAQAQAQATIDLGFSKLVQDKNLSFMDATNAANMLQAQLDQAYNGSLIDNARYSQMTQSLQAQLAMEQARLKEQGRQFDITRADSQQNTNLQLEEAAKLRRERGVDPNTGQRFGQSHTQTGRPGSVFQNI